MPRISVVVPSYNRQDLLPRALKSISKQTYRDFDVVVVNDGGHWDDNFDVSFLDCDIRVIHRKNGGPGAARNSGIAETDSELIAYLDDDDRWHENHLETMVNAVSSRNVSMAFGIADVRDAGSRVRFWGDCTFNKFILDGFHTIFPLSACVHTRKLASTVGNFDENPLLVGPEDCEFVIRCSDRVNPVATRQCTVTMFRERSMTRAVRSTWVDTLEYVIEKLDYRERRRNWMMLYRAVLAAANEHREQTLTDWINVLDAQLPKNVRRVGLNLCGSVELTPATLKSYCRAELEEQ